MSSLMAQIAKHLSTMQKTQVQSLGRQDPLEKEMATHSVWREPGDGLQSMGSQRVRHDWATNTFTLGIWYWNKSASFIGSCSCSDFIYLYLSINIVIFEKNHLLPIPLGSGKSPSCPLHQTRQSSDWELKGAWSSPKTLMAELSSKQRSPSSQPDTVS